MMRVESSADVLREVVCPALEAVFQPAEVDEVHLERTELDGGLEFELRIIARGERFATVAFSTFVQYPEVGPSSVLRDQLVDFVAESRFGWGQNRGV